MGNLGGRHGVIPDGGAIFTDTNLPLIGQFPSRLFDSLCLICVTHQLCHEQFCLHREGHFFWDLVSYIRSYFVLYDI